MIDGCHLGWYFVGGCFLWGDTESIEEDRMKSRRLFSHRCMASNTPTSRWFATMVDIPSQGCLMYAGVSDNTQNSFLSDCWLWNGTWVSENIPTTGSFSNGLTPMPPPHGIAKAEHVAAYTGSGMMEFGGVNENTWTNDTFLYNSGVWTNRTINQSISYLTPGGVPSNQPYVAPNNLRGAAACYVSGQSLAYVWGGRSSISRHYIGTLWSYSGTTASYTDLTDTPPLPFRAYHCMAGSSTQFLVGSGSNFSGLLSDWWLYNPSGTGTWTQVSSVGSLGQGSTAPSARQGAALTWDATANLWVLFGGLTANYYAFDTWTFSPTTLQWTNQGPSNFPQGRANHNFTYCSQFGYNLLTNGKNNQQSFDDVWSYVVATNSWTRLL